MTKTKPKKATNIRKSPNINKHNENNITKTITGIILLVIVAILIFGLTYAYFTATINDSNKDNKDVQIQVADLLVRYIDGNSNIELDDKIVPGDTIEKEFSIKNEGNDTGYYTIVLDKYQNTFDRVCDNENTESDLDFSLIRLDSEGNEISKIIGTLPCTTGVSIFTIAKNESVDIIKDNDGNIISDTNYYKLIINYENLTTVDQSEDMGSILEGRINIIESEDEQRTQSNEY